MTISKVLALIGARAGSKGLPFKNIKAFCGRPLINWTIDAALQARFVDKVIVSTDSLDIANIARTAGADVPFIRPPELATDSASVQQVIMHALSWVKNNTDQLFDYIILLQPTSPLRTTEHIDQAIQYYFEHRTTLQDTLISVSRVPAKMAWLMQTRQEKYVDFCIQKTDVSNLQRQNNPIYYLPNGAIYMAPVIEGCDISFYTEKTLFFEMDERSSVDIDTLEDFVLAEKFMKQNKP